MTADAPPTLLFAHGGGFCKETWEPILRRLQDSPLFQRVEPEIVTFDFPYHGSKRDESVAAQLDLSNPKTPRVSHPAQDLTKWTSEEVWRQVQQLREDPTRKETPLIGIGHSMGACALWKVEVDHPGTFAGLILFEPVYGFSKSVPEHRLLVDFLVAITLQRQFKWSTQEEAYAYFEQLKNFARWDRESLAAYLKGAVVKETDGSVALACHPHIEASLYCHTPLLLSPEELTQPKCEKITFHYGDRTRMFLPHLFNDMEAKLPQLYKVGEPMPGLSHVMVLEDPALSATKILEDLVQLAPFREEV